MIQKIPREIRKEFSILRNMGLREDEIDYLMHLKIKNNARHKWRH